MATLAHPTHLARQFTAQDEACGDLCVKKEKACGSELMALPLRIRVLSHSDSQLATT